MEKSNAHALDWILDTFVDIPEVHLVSLVIFSLVDISKIADGMPNHERLDKILQRKFDKSLLTSSLKHIAYEDVKTLLGYINNLIRTQWQFEVELEDESPMQSWLKWSSALIDAHYTKFILHNDTNIIDSLLESVSECTQVLKEVEDMEPYLLMTYSKTSFEPAPDTMKRWRTETITFE